MVGKQSIGCFVSWLPIAKFQQPSAQNQLAASYSDVIHGFFT
jgi:hypothetical protein